MLTIDTHFPFLRRSLYFFLILTPCRGLAARGFSARGAVFLAAGGVEGVGVGGAMAMVSSASSASSCIGSSGVRGAAVDTAPDRICSIR